MAAKWWWLGGTLSVVLLVLVVYLAFPQDKIVLTDKGGSDSPAILLDGNRSSCVNDQILRGDTVQVGNMLQQGACPTSEIAVFAQDNAVQFKSPVDSWTTARTDVVTIKMASPWGVPLTAWSLTGHPGDADTHKSGTNTIYNTMQAGIIFNLEHHPFENGGRISVASCEDLTPLKTAFPPVTGVLNVYYVPMVTATDNLGTFNVDGRWCSGDPNIVLMGEFYDETLAHELGHALSLWHTDLVLPQSNLMFSAPVDRDSLTTGQVFRINMNPNSAINLNHNRMGLTRSCPDSTSDDFCPALTLDALPK